MTTGTATSPQMESPSHTPAQARDGSALGAPPCSEFLEWSAKAGYATCTSDIQLALWEAWQAGRKTARDLIAMWELTLRNRNGITWNEMDAGDTMRLRRSVDELRAVIIPNIGIDKTDTTEKRANP